MNTLVYNYYTLIYIPINYNLKLEETYIKLLVQREREVKWSVCGCQ